MIKRIIRFFKGDEFLIQQNEILRIALIKNQEMITKAHSELNEQIYTAQFYREKNYNLEIENSHLRGRVQALEIELKTIYARAK